MSNQLKLKNSTKIEPGLGININDLIHTVNGCLCAHFGNVRTKRPK